VVRRLGAEACLVVLHAFGGAIPAQVDVPLPDPGWRLAGSFPGDDATVAGGSLHLKTDGPWSGCVALLAR
jgi:hypothetical protein